MERLAEGFEGLSRACSCESCLGKEAARVALERPAEGFEGFEGFEQTAVLNALKNRWLKPVAARVALERPAEGFEALSRACSCESCLGKAWGRV